MGKQSHKETIKLNLVCFFPWLLSVPYCSQRKARISVCIVAVVIWQQKLWQRDFIYMPGVSVANTLPSVFAPRASSSLIEKWFPPPPPPACLIVYFITMFRHFIMLFDLICLSLNSGWCCHSKICKSFFDSKKKLQYETIYSKKLLLLFYFVNRVFCLIFYL